MSQTREGNGWRADIGRVLLAIALLAGLAAFSDPRNPHAEPVSLAAQLPQS